jgi:hypothetical protein
MQAPDWPTLFKFEDFLEAGAKSILTAAGLTAYIARSEDVATTPRVEIAAQIAANRESYFQVAGTVYPAAWDAMLAFEIRTRRDEDKTSDAHALYRGTLRWKMLDPRNWTETVLPHHQLLRILEQTTAPEIDQEQGQDVSRIAFSVIICIRTDAWPTV